MAARFVCAGRSNSTERSIHYPIERGLRIQQLLRIDPLSTITLALTGVQGYRIFTGAYMSSAFQQDTLTASVIVEAFKTPLHEITRPVFNAVWNEAGYPQSTFYRGDGTQLPMPHNH